MSTTYVNHTVEAIDCYDSQPATVEVTASIGEFEGIVVGFNLPGRHESIELTLDKAIELRTALDEAIGCLGSHQ